MRAWSRRQSASETDMDFPVRIAQTRTRSKKAHCPMPPDRRDKTVLVPHEMPARLTHMLKDYIAAMNLIAKTTENFARPPALNPMDEGNDYIWIEEMLEGVKDGDETPERRAPFIETLRLLFDAWCAGGTPEGEELRNQAKAAYERLSSEERELWEQQTAAR
jgi:hypothetical protein